jgi:hypothetical protein
MCQSTSLELWSTGATAYAGRGSRFAGAVDMHFMDSSKGRAKLIHLVTHCCNVPQLYHTCQQMS